MTNGKAGGKHPKGLYVLFFTEMWERFGYYLMLGIFSLYMLDSAANGGMGFDKATKSDIYGTYLGLVYLTPFIGGLLADRILGYRRSVVIGGLLMAAGYFGLGLNNDVGTLYISLLLIILGNGFFKPNISTLVGNLYNNDQYRANKDAGYNIFYMGINIGSFICNFVAAYFRINFGWGWAFWAAGFGMLLGLAIFMIWTKHVKEADVIKPVQKEDKSIGYILASVFIPLFIMGIIGWFIPGNLLGSDANDAFIFGCIPVVLFYVMLWKRASEEDKKPIAALLTVFACVVVFWAVFHQNGDALTVWAEEYTDREIPKPAESVFTTLKIDQTVVNDPDLFAVPDSTFKKRMKSGEERIQALIKANDKTEYKLIQDSLALESHSRTYFQNLPEEKRPPVGQNLKLISTEIFQSINPFWVVLLTPIIVGFFGFLRRRNLEPSTPAKIAYGLLITGISALVMVMAVWSVDIHDEKASAWWLINSYLVITIGELFLSPMGLSLVSKLSPPRLTALMMGGWFLSTSVGNKLSGMLGGLWEGIDNKANYFFINFALCALAFVLLFSQLKWLKKTMQDKNIF
ncbi:MAG: peptide MFS transporter [Flavobacteriales bacterium]|nr:MFS transporter [Flavobacteriales bacterium]HRE74584.1 peptide MFS transporter [Flavobacteriales bacterium]HRJ35266.1 peptide MFS transporter [Flavobacteriales bacterium]HRJ39920.1 peptide MFS transporter [Flavobacteriales bacterium]